MQIPWVDFESMHALNLSDSNMLILIVAINKLKFLQGEGVKYGLQNFETQ